MAFTMAGRLRLKALHEALFYGSIAAIRVSHGAPPDCKVVSTESIPDVARIAALAHIFCTVVKTIGGFAFKTDE
jgi:hypothetical protein